MGCRWCWGGVGDGVSGVDGGDVGWVSVLAVVVLVILVSHVEWRWCCGSWP